MDSSTDRADLMGRERKPKENTIANVADALSLLMKVRKVIVSRIWIFQCILMETY